MGRVSVGQPEALPFLYPSAAADDINGVGGNIVVKTAGMTLNWGDIVFILPGGRAYKSLEVSPYFGLPTGVVVGGQTLFGRATNDPAYIGVQMATAGQQVLIQTSGLCYANVDATGIKAGDPLISGTTTAGRILGGAVGSYSENNPGLAIKAGGSTLVKAVNATRRIHAGAVSTNSAANLDQAALSGTVTNGKFGIFVFRIASDGTTVTSASAVDAATLAEVIWPTAGAANLATLGFVIVNPTGTGNFVGGTTALDDGTVVPNAKYYNLVGFRPYLGWAVEAGGAAGTAVLIQLANT